MALITYLRVSTNDQSIDNQRRQIQEAGYQVEQDFEFYDDGVSGAVPAQKRPALNEAIKTARKGDVFVVVAIDRLGRDAVDVLTTVKTLDSKGVKVVSLREGFDLSTPAGKMMLHMMAGFAEMEKNTKTLQADLDKKVTETQPIIDGFDGLMARINALGKLPWLPSFFIFLLFLAIETAPIIAKLLAPKGEYDYRFEEQETVVSTWVAQKVSQRKLLMSTDVDINHEVYSAIKTEEELFRYKKKMAEELLKKQADAFHKVQMKGL